MTYKLLTYDLRPPIQGGEPIFDGECPYALPHRDTDAAVCSGPGWHSTERLSAAYRIAGMWGRPYLVEPSGTIVRGDGEKIKSSDLTIVRPCTDEECRQGILDLTASWAGKHSARLVDSQRAWQIALARPYRDEAAVMAGLRAAIDIRGLSWNPRKFDTVEAARDAWNAWDAWNARAARAAWNAWNAWAARDAWNARAARDAWDAWDARDALVVESAALMGWHRDDPDRLTTGIRDAYAHGLGVAVPVEDGILGWAMQ